MSGRATITFAAARRNRNAGFTLFELLVVIGILSVVTGIGTGAFFLMTSEWNELKSGADLDAIAYSAFDVMQKDFADVASVELSGVPIRGVANEYEFDSKLPPYKDDQIILPLQTSAIGERSLTGSSVRYHINRDDNAEGGHRLIRSIGELTSDFPIGSALPVIQQANVLSLRFEFLAGELGDWEPGWDSLELPAAVRVSLTLADLYRSDLQVSHKAVFPIHVR